MINEIIDFALERLIKDNESYTNDDERLIYEAAIRSKEIWQNIKVNGIDSCGLTFEQFCEVCKEKNNILFLTDEEIKEFFSIRDKYFQIKDIINKGE